MLFDAGLSERRNDDFVKSATIRFLQGAAPDRTIKAGLEWQAEDQALLQHLYAHGLVRSYVVVGFGYDLRAKDSFGTLGPFDKIPVTFPDWQLGKPLRVPSGSIDFSVLTVGGLEALGPEKAAAALKEAARMLRQTGQMVLFLPMGEELPSGTMESFSVKERAQSQDGILEAYLLIPRPEAGPKLIRRRKRVAP